MNIIFSIQGGIGKCVMATAVCSAIKKKHPKSKLIVVSGYSDVFLNNPHVDRTYEHGRLSYFYEEYLQNKNVLVFANDPYLTTSHINQNEHLIKTWCEMFDIPYNGEQPQIYLTPREQKYFGAMFTTEKPIFLFQANGGSPTELKYSWARDIPFDLMQSIVDEFKGNYTMLHICRDDQAKYRDAQPIHATIRQLCVLITLSHKRLFIDSFAQHVAASFGLPSVVCWIANKPEVFGYDIHTNIVSNPYTIKPELRNSFLHKFNIQGDLMEFPYNSENEIFDKEEIISAILALNQTPSLTEL
jgi:hypothetical protein